MKEVRVQIVTTEELQKTIQDAKNAGERILALAAYRTYKGIVKSYTLVTQ
jgi:LAS superfamily LD-carboxypeptidase LdcB